MGGLFDLSDDIAGPGLVLTRPHRVLPFGAIMSTHELRRKDGSVSGGRRGVRRRLALPLAERRPSASPDAAVCLIVKKTPLLLLLLCVSF